MEGFVTKLESFTNTQWTTVNLGSEWEKHNPTGA